MYVIGAPGLNTVPREPMAGPEMYPEPKGAPGSNDLILESTGRSLDLLTE